MTVIAWDGKTLAADKRASGGTITVVTKIRRVKNGMLLGASGSGSIAREMMAWAEAGEDASKWPTSADKDEGSLIVIDRSGIRVYYARPFPMQPEGPHFAMGSGEPYAMAAMYLGCDARHAVEVACALHETCGNGIDTLELDQ